MAGMIPNRSRRGIPRSFTLVELLVVVSVIALLMAIFLPGLRKSREQAKRVACASNLSQLGKSMITYGIELDGFPILISTAAKSFSWCTWSFGGWTGRNPYWVGYSDGVFHSDTNQRPLNQYLVNFRQGLKGCGDGTQPHQPPGESTPLPLYKCPSDSVELRQLYEPTGAGQELHQFNSYDDVGTSYRLNYHWFYQAKEQVQAECPDCPIDPELYRKVARKGQSYWKKYLLRGAARFIMFAEQPANLGFFRKIQTIGFHRQFSRHNFAFLDGHVEYLEVDTRQRSGRDWTVWNEEVARQTEALSP